MPRSPRQRRQIERVRPLAGIASMEGRTPEERSEFARKGGLAGGLARAKKLSKRRRSEIARNAALARWGNRPKIAKPRKMTKPVDVNA